MDILIFATLGLCTLALLWSFKRPQAMFATIRPTAARAPEQAPTSAPRRITSPRRAGQTEVKVWVLHASDECDLTKSLLDGRRYTTAEAPSLPGIGCNLSGCHCHYQPVADTRRGEQRKTNERRGEFRFQSRNERRLHIERRESNGWLHASRH